MAGNREVITGSDFKRMVTGAYSEFLLEYENINELNRRAGADNSGMLGTNILRTMGAAVMPLSDSRDESIGGIARRVASAAVLGARGNAGVVLSQLFRGIAKGLFGKYSATSSEFGKAFQYGILYGQRVLPEEPERPIITAARAVAKGAYHAVRANLPISEILTAAVAAGEKSMSENPMIHAGTQIMIVFLQGCLKGLDGNFVSPVLNFSSTFKSRQPLPNPRADIVQPYCLTFLVENSKADSGEVEKMLQEGSSFVVVERSGMMLHIHLHTARPGSVIEQAVGLGALHDVKIINMSESHALAAVRSVLMPVAVLAIAESQEWAERLQKSGATVIVEGDRTASPSVGELINAAHSDIAASYVMLSNSCSLRLVLQQVKRILGNRVELVQSTSSEEQQEAMRVFGIGRPAKENAERMREVLMKLRK
jgi:uncharacterized protein